MAISNARQRSAAAEVLCGKSALPLDPEEWGRQWLLEPGEATRLVRDERRRRDADFKPFRSQRRQ